MTQPLYEGQARMKFFTHLSAFLQLIFGKFSWENPSWMKHLRPKQFGSLVLIVLLLISSIVYGLRWVHSLPQGEQITVNITLPELTPVAKTLVPEKLFLDFGVMIDGEFNYRAVAPISLIGKNISDNIRITPAIAGKWLWDADSRLVFTPEQDWPPHQTYTIFFNKNLFAPDTNMASMKVTFTTKPFEASISEFRFYQDPLKADVRQAVASIHFTFPVDPLTLEKNLRLNWQGTNTAAPFTLTYDENKRTAYLHSASLALPERERYLELTLNKKIEALANHAALSKQISVTLLIPDASTYFSIRDINTAIINNQQDRPEQILTIETSLGVTQTELDKFVHVYVLPKDYPRTSAEEAKPNYQWKDPGEVTDAILALGKPLPLNAIPALQDYADLHSYQYHALTPTYLYVKIDKGMQGFGRFTLTQPYQTILKAPAFPKQISFLHKGALLALGSEEKLSVLVRGLSAVKFDIARVLPDDINHLITQTSGDFSNPYFTNENFNQNNISEISSQIQSFDATDPGKEQYTALDLGKYLAAKTHPLGLFLLRAQGFDAAKKKTLETQTSRLVLITNLGLIVKDNADATHDIFVQSITEGTPVKNAAVAILGKNGLPLLTRTTDANGHAVFPSLKDFNNEREPTVYIVKNGSDVSFISYERRDRQLNYSRFETGGINSHRDNQAALTAYLFSDRGIYRPGDTAHIGIIVKQPWLMPQAAGIPLEASMVDPRGVAIKTTRINLDESGYFSLDVQTTPTSLTGPYQVYLYIVKDNHASSLIGSASIQVAEFLPDRLRIAEHLSQQTKQGWISPDNLRANIQLWNLYGAPAVHHRIAGKMILNPHAVSFREFKDYTFIDPLIHANTPAKVFTDTLPDITTNEKGEASFDLKLDRFEKATYQLTVFAEGFEAEGGRSVAAQTTALVSPLAFLIGYKVDGDLQYINQNANRSIHFIAVNPALKQQALPDLTLKLFSQQPVSTLVKKDDGTYQYQSIIKTSEISSSAFNIAEQGTDYILPATIIGDFLVTVSTKDGTELSRLKYSIVGKSQQPLPKNAELNVKLNKTEFNPGDTIEMQITAPYTGAGLVTIERDKVYASAWFKTNTTSSLQKIQLPKDFEGNGYINIAFVRDLNSPEIFMSPLSYSVQPFSVTHQNHAINVNLDTPALARPGDHFSIAYKTDKPCKIIVFAVDEGILQAARYQTPDPLAFFFQKYALEVKTLQIVDQILPKFMAERELSAVGGDEGEQALKSNLNPFKRKAEAAVVYWSGILDADATSRNLIWQIPDYFNGSLRVMAVAVAGNAAGSAAKTAEIRGYFVIQPNVPTFVAPSDEFEVTASIANNIEGSGSHANVVVNLQTTSPLEIIGETKQNLVIPEGQERVSHFKVRARSTLAAAELKFTATLGDKSSTTLSTLSVRPPVPYATSIHSGNSSDAATSLTLDRQLYPDYRKVEAALSTNPLILITGIQRYLDDYPYGCVEQLVSKAIPWLVMRNQQDKIQKTIQMLNQRQMTNGGFSYWPEVGNYASNDFASVYAMHFLTEARAQNYTVPSEVFSAGIAYLKDLAAKNIATLDDARLHAYAIYILTRNEIVTSNYLTHLQLSLDENAGIKWRNDITSAYMAATWQLLKNNNEAEKLIATPPQVSDSSDFYNRDVANAQYLYLLAKHFPARLQAVSKTMLPSLVAALNNNTISTILSGYTTLALSAYPEAAASTDALTVSEVLANHEERALSSTLGVYKIDLDGKKIIFNNPSRQLFFYQLTQAGFDRELPQENIREGIEVFREYRDKNDKPLSDVKTGDEIIVHIRVRATDNQYHANNAVVDLLPGGFEVVRDSISSPADMDYVDMREDRVVFFGSIHPDTKEIVYRIKAVSAGKFIVPPVLASSMYNPAVRAMMIYSEKRLSIS
jgi:uncharacterized protein YfaS (alpha-2-macroglobulin family)